jgi:hypothetical protein
MTKGLIELDVKFVRYVQTICSNFIRPRTFDEIEACMVQPGEDEAEDINVSDS